MKKSKISNIIAIIGLSIYFLFTSCEQASAPEANSSETTTKNDEDNKNTKNENTKNENTKNENTDKPIIEDKTPPAEISNITYIEGNNSVSFSWKNPDDNDFVKTQITFTPNLDAITQPIIIQGEVGGNSSKLIEGLSNGTEYTFTFKTLDGNNNKSQGIVKTATPKPPADLTPPSEISEFQSVSKHKRIELSWKNPSDSDFVAVEISTNPAAGALLQPIIIQTEPSVQKTFTATGLENGTEYTFIIKTLDSSNNKSEGMSLQATPVESTLSLNVTLPNDSGNIILTKDKAPINVSVVSSNPIKKAVWKKGDKNVIPTAEEVLNDLSSTNFSKTNFSIFYVTENGVYDIAVENDEGICSCKQVEIKTIDNEPLAEVTNYCIECDGSNVTLSWKNPTTKTEYDSPLNMVTVSWIYNNNLSDINNRTVNLSSNSTNYTFSIPYGKNENDSVQVKIKTVDEVGNTSDGKQDYIWCCYCIKNLENLVEKIKNIPNTVSILKIIGCDWFADFKTGCSELRKKGTYGKNVRIDLDLSNTTITDIPEKAFSRNSNLRNIVLPETITNIGDYAFSGCINLLSVNIPETVRNIGIDAFSSCESLESINIPCDLWEIGSGTFMNCTNLKSVYIKKIEKQSGLWSNDFKGCVNLKNVKIDYVRCIGDHVFSGCESLEEIELPLDCEYIGGEAFINCKNLSNVIIGEKIDTICKSAFYKCPKLTTVIFNNISKKWFKTENGITQTTKKSELKGTSIGWPFTNNSAQNAAKLTETYLNYCLYSEDYKPLLQ